MKHSNRVLSAVLAVVMLVLAFPVIALPTVAAEAVAEAPTLTYKDIVVQDGLEIWLDAYDPANASIDIAGGTWKSEKGTATATIAGGAYNASSNPTGWYAAEKGIKWDNNQSVKSGIVNNLIGFNLAEVPQGSYTVESIITLDGMTEDDGNGGLKRYNHVYHYYFKTTTVDGVTTTATSRTTISGNEYGYAYGEVFAFGPFRSMTFINGGMTRIRHGYDEATGKYTDEILATESASDFWASRWYYTGLICDDHGSQLTSKYPGMGALISGGEQIARNFDIGEVLNFTATYQLSGGDTWDTAASATMGVTYNGTGVSATVEAKNITKTDYAGKMFPINAGFNKMTGEYDASRAKYQIMYRMAGTVYSVRIYDHVLTVNEKNQNHFADIVALLDYDLSAFAAFDSAARSYVYNKAAALELDTVTKAEVDAIIADATAIDVGMTDIDKLYVQDGLVALYSAFDQSKAGVVKADTGMFTGWINKIDGTIAAFANYTDVSNAANNVWWKLRDGKGLGYDLTQAQFGTDSNAVGIKAYLYLGDGIVDVADDYTVEYAGVMMRISADGVQTNSGNGSSTHNTESHHNKFGAWGDWILSMTSTDDQVRVTYNANGVNSNWGHTMITNCKMNLWANNGSTVKSISNVMTIASDASSAARKTYDNATLKKTHTVPCGGASKVITNSKGFWMAQNCGNTLYAIRVYDRALSLSEIAYNANLDKCAYFGLDISGLVGYSADALAVALVGLSDYSFTADAAAQAEMQKIVNNAANTLAKMEVAQSSLTAYDKLYVEDGLVTLLSAYGDDNASLDIANGYWYNKLADGAVALKGDKWTATNGKEIPVIKTSWSGSSVTAIEKTGTVALNGGIGYSMTYDEWTADKATGSNYIDLLGLPVDYYTVEAAQMFIGLTDKEGLRYVDGANKWGVYTGSFGGYEFGAFKGVPFVSLSSTTDAGSGQLALRTIYRDTGYWGNGQYWFKSNHHQFIADKYASAPITVAYTHEVGYFDRSVSVYDASGDKAAKIDGVTYTETDVKGVAFKIYENGNVMTNLNTVTDAIGYGYKRAVKYTDAHGVEQTGYIPYLSKSEAYISNEGKNAFLMRGFPGVVFAIRVYDRALTAAETEWNSLVDIAAYVGANVDALAGISDVQKAGLGAAAAAANLSYTSSKAEVEAVIAQGAALLATYVTDALGYQKGNDGTSLRIWASANLAAVQNATALGMEIKVTGDAEKMLSGETDRVFLSVKNGDKVVCPAAEDTYYFAAIVEGIPADKNFTFTITPYAVVDGVKVYGDSVTLEWPAVE